MRQWRTADRPESEQYSYWREVVCEAFTPLRPAARGTRDSWDRGGLNGWVDAHAYGKINGAEIETCDQTIHHGREELSRIEDEVVFVNLMLRGRCVVSQGASTCLSGPGTFSIVDATRTFHLDYLDDWRTLSFRIPVRSLPHGLPAEVNAVTYSAAHGMGSIVADTMRAAWRSAATLTEAQATSTGTALASLVNALAHGMPTGDHVNSGTNDDAIRDSIEHYLTRHLLYGDTSPAAIAHHFGISVRKLHLLYEDAPATFSQTVMRLRAHLCAEDLLAHQGRVTLTDLAMKWGFSDLSHLNRVFRRQFGYRAAEYTRIRSAERAFPDPLPVESA
ncbi:helix-turn-helix domain-containing protein [Streptomyces sp. NPDC047081]|uniref:AraC-like ligand-binding domain-containing protein n=1 Tax=Streptomyces sp. NPDC047081 TaxID=3154706 RepID=UPI0033C3076F